MADLEDDVKAGVTTTVATDDGSVGYRDNNEVVDVPEQHDGAQHEAVGNASGSATMAELMDALAEDVASPGLQGAEVNVVQASTDAESAPPSLHGSQATEQPSSPESNHESIAAAMSDAQQDTGIITASPTLQADLDTSMASPDDADSADQPSAAILAASDALHAVSDGLVNAVNTFHPALGTSDDNDAADDLSADVDPATRRLHAVLQQFQGCLSVEQLAQYAKRVKTTTALDEHDNALLRRAFGRRKAELQTVGHLVASVVVVGIVVMGCIR
jgi:hypothetical protein